MRILLLGGTGEARRLAARLAGEPRFAATLSFAGRTPIADEQPLPVRIGGFGGVEGLRDYLRTERIDAVVDATHPFAAAMSANAALACERAAVPLARLTRAGWQPGPGDDWRPVADFAAAAAALGEEPRRVFLTIGQGGLDAFARQPQHAYLVRSIGAPDGFDVPCARFLLDRPPYRAEDEEALMRAERIDILVTKNSGGAATSAKLEAARRLAIPVVMIERPAGGTGTLAFFDAEAAIAWLDRVQAERGV